MNGVKRSVCILVGCCLLLVTACSPFIENNTVEEIAPATFLSLSKGDDGKLKISTLAPPLMKEQKRLLTIEVDLLKEGRKRLNLNYYREFKFGQLRLLLISEELARQGIMSIINTIFVDPEITQRLYLVIVKGNFDDYLRNNLDKQEDLEYFLYRMFKHYEKKNQGQVTVVNLHQFMKLYYSPFSDPILPVLTADQDNLHYQGTAFFRDDRLVASIATKEDHIFQLIDNEHFLKLLPIPDLSVTLGRVHAKVKMNWNRSNDTLSVTAAVSGRIEEYRGSKVLYEPSELLQIRSQIEAYLEKETTALLEDMRRMKVNPLPMESVNLHPFGIPLSEEVWRREWEQMKFRVDYRVVIEPLTISPSNHRNK
jgi:spore germination protein